MPTVVHSTVFSAGAHGGNPCPVTLHAESLCTEEMLALTRRYAQESAFVLPADRPDCQFRVRYFVPLHEMEMCIHATIAVVTVLVRQKLALSSPVMLSTLLGPIQADWRERDGVLTVDVHQFLPKFHRKNPTAAEVCRALRIAPEQLAPYPIQSASTSRFKLIVPLADCAVLDALEPDTDALNQVCDTYDTTGFYPFAVESGGQTPVLCARQFPCRSGYPEDPATGVAASALGAYLAQNRVFPLQEGWNACLVRQGVAMGRPSLLRSEVCMSGGVITGTKICGSAELLDAMQAL